MILTNQQQIKKAILGESKNRPKYAILGDNALLVKIASVDKNVEQFQFEVINGGYGGTYDFKQVKSLSREGDLPIMVAGDIYINNDYSDSMWVFEKAFKNEAIDFPNEHRCSAENQKSMEYLFDAIRKSLDGETVKDDFNAWFNPGNDDHIMAFDHLRKNGTWPVDFIPDHVEQSANWYPAMLEKMAFNLADRVIEEQSFGPEM